MADEAIIVELLGNGGDPISFNCADGDAFPKGTILKLSDNREADLSAADGDCCAGICSMEKVASDGSTTVTAFTNGIFKLTDAGAGFTVGLPVTIGGANKIKQVAAGEAEGGTLLGFALATAGAGAVEEVRVLIGKRC